MIWDPASHSLCLRAKFATTSSAPQRSLLNCLGDPQVQDIVTSTFKGSLVPLMSAYQNTSRSSFESTPTSTSSTLPIGANPSDIPSNINTSTIRQSTWSAAPYDPFSGRTQQDRPRMYSDSRFPLAAQLPERQSVEPWVEPAWQGFDTQMQQDAQSMSMSPSHYYNGDVLPPSHGPTESPARARRRSLEASSTFGRSSSMSEYNMETISPQTSEPARGEPRHQPRRRPYNQDEFDGPAQLIPQQLTQQEQMRAQPLPQLPIHLNMDEQDEIGRQANDILAQCAFHFVAKYQFPIPLERDKPRVRMPADREWAEWAYLLKRLATKRRIPARVLYDNQIKQFVTTLENSISVRQTTSTARGSQHLPVRIPKDDRYILQMISSGIQVAKILMDSLAMSQLDNLYARTEAVVLERRNRAARPDEYGY